MSTCSRIRGGKESAHFLFQQGNINRFGNMSIHTCGSAVAYSVHVAVRRVMLVSPAGVYLVASESRFKRICSIRDKSAYFKGFIRWKRSWRLLNVVVEYGISRACTGEDEPYVMSGGTYVRRCIRRSCERE